MRKVGFLLAVVVASVALAGCGGSSSSSSSSGGGGGSSSSAPVTLTLWHNYGTEQNAVATKNLVTAYEKLHPNVTIKIVSQPADNYFALLKAAADLTHRPGHRRPVDRPVHAPGHQLPDQAEGPRARPALDKMKGLQWMSSGLSTSGDPYVMPLEDQFYIGFYNKSAFAKAGHRRPCPPTGHS